VTSAAGGWRVRRLRDAAAALHAEPMPGSPARLIWVLEATAPALVLGSTQTRGVVDLEAARDLEIDVVRRHSGGGVVLVVPGEMAWVDVIVPAGDPLWDDDVGRASRWVGRAWQAALRDLGTAPTEVHAGPLWCGPLGRLVCFGAIAAGEVTATAADGARRKVVGISQRRTRAAARFQCAVYRHWDPEALARLLRLDESAGRALDEAALGTGRQPAEMVDAFLRHLPA
jgi:lipoate-protein ligase A